MVILEIIPELFCPQGGPRIVVFCGSSVGTDPVFEARAYETGKLLANLGIGLV